MKGDGLKMNNTAVITTDISVFVVAANVFLFLLRIAIIIVTSCEQTACWCDKWLKT